MEPPLPIRPPVRSAGQRIRKRASVREGFKEGGGERNVGVEEAEEEKEVWRRLATAVGDGEGEAPLVSGRSAAEEASRGRFAAGEPSIGTTPSLRLVTVGVQRPLVLGGLSRKTLRWTSPGLERVNTKHKVCLENPCTTEAVLAEVTILVIKYLILL